MKFIPYLILLLLFSCSSNKKSNNDYDNDVLQERYTKILKSEYSRDQFTACLKQHKSQMKGSGLYHHEGTIALIFDFYIDPNGEVRDLKIYPDTRSLAPLNQCLFFKFQTLKFPQGEPGKINYVRHSLKFSFK